MKLITAGQAALTSRAIFFLALALIGCSAPRQEAPALPPPQVKETQTGWAAFYGQALQGVQTASGKSFDRDEMTAAHPSYPLGTKVRVTNLENGRAAEVRINDRGPAAKHRRKGVIIDLSHTAASQLGFTSHGRARGRVEVLEWGDDRENEEQ